MKSEKKLTLNKETLRQLEPREAQAVEGGVVEPTMVSKCFRCRTLECR